jgi:twinkle protein
MTSAINPAVLRWFAGRGISENTVDRLAIFSGRRLTNGDDSEVVADPTGNIIVFPFYDGGRVVAEKYRSAGKRFSQRPNPYKTFFNAHVISSPSVIEGDARLVIVEGEMDCAAVVEAGHDFVVSVPDGAPPARDGKGKLIDVPDDARDVDPDNDEKFAYVFNNWEALKRVKKIVIATDNDDPGRRLAAELVRRLGRVRCYFVEWPDDCKDMNDVLMKRGGSAVVRMINAAKEYPVRNVYRFSDLPDEPELSPVTTGWSSLDGLIKLYHPALLVVTGRAGHGKSSWTQQLVANLARLHGWNIAIASFEMRIKPFVSNALLQAFEEKHISQFDATDRREAEWILENRFCFIAPEPEDEAVHDIDWLLEKAEAAVIRYGARVLLIDPWNEIEHSRRGGESQSEYTNRAVKDLKAFGRRFDVLVIIVAHPTKLGAAKEPNDLSLYDVSDSAAFQNKADFGVVIARLGDPTESTQTGVFVRKVRYQPETGSLGTAELSFDNWRKLFF